MTSCIILSPILEERSKESLLIMHKYQSIYLLLLNLVFFTTVAMPGRRGIGKDGPSMKTEELEKWEIY